jgi:predicted nucleotidyltransferase
MAPIPNKIQIIISDFISKLSKEIPVRKAVVFGSYAKGSFDEQSDIDVAVFSEHFETMTRIDGISFLLLKAMEYNVDLEPIAFTSKEYDERLGIVDEIIRTGLDIPAGNWNG